MKTELQQTIAEAIAETTGSAFSISNCRPQGGGCINEAWLLSDSGTSYFVKLNSAAGLAMFEAEAAALKELAATGAIKVPQPITYGTASGQSYLILEAIPFGSAKSGSWETMGRQLARLHRSTARSFGWHRDNVIGSTPQRNDWFDGWTEFFRERRLRPQFEMARKNGYEFAQADSLLGQVGTILAGHKPEASLLHGDLWSGNAGFLDDGTPVIYDPATYYGDRETDLAFSEFFGGFPASFYAAYEKEWPLAPGYETRKTLYNLYHVLNHANLFGGGYAGQASSTISELLR
jgi:fructosamine-3-kinase